MTSPPLARSASNSASCAGVAPSSPTSGMRGISVPPAVGDAAVAEEEERDRLAVGHDVVEAHALADPVRVLDVARAEDDHGDAGAVEGARVGDRASASGH